MARIGIPLAFILLGVSLAPGGRTIKSNTEEYDVLRDVLPSGSWDDLKQILDNGRQLIAQHPAASIVAGG